MTAQNRTKHCLAGPAIRTRIARSHGTAEIERSRTLLNVVHQRDIVIRAELKRVAREFLREIHKRCVVAPDIAVVARIRAPESLVQVGIHERQKRRLEQAGRQPDIARVRDTKADRGLALLPTTIGNVRIDDPGGTRSRGIVYDNLKAGIVVGGVIIGTIAEEAGGRIILAYAVRHAREDAVRRSLIPIHAPIELIIGGQAFALRKVVVQIVDALAGAVWQRIQVENLLAD